MSAALRADPRPDIALMGEQIAAIRENIRGCERRIADHMRTVQLAIQRNATNYRDPVDLRSVERELGMAQAALSAAKAFREGEKRITAGHTFTASEFEQLVAEDIRRAKAEAASAYVKAAAAGRAPRVEG